MATDLHVIVNIKHEFLLTKIDFNVLPHLPHPYDWVELS